MPPGVPQAPQIIPPRQAGESQYAYRNRRSVMLTGETLYQRRQRQGRERGLTTREAAGHPTILGETEYQRRRRVTLQRYGLTPSQLRLQNIDSWLAQNGFSPATTGFSQTKLRQMYAGLRWMNEHSTPGGEITPQLLYEARDMEFSGDLEPDWTFDRIMKRYEAMREFKEMNNKALGNFYWFRERIPDMDKVWWYYHLWRESGAMTAGTGATGASAESMVKVGISPTPKRSSEPCTHISFSVPVNTVSKILTDLTSGNVQSFCADFQTNESTLHISLTTT